MRHVIYVKYFHNLTTIWNILSTLVWQKMFQHKIYITDFGKTTNEVSHKVTYDVTFV